jgi:hypothetical protein
MTENSRIVAVVKGQLSKFSGIISKGLPKSKQRLVREMLYGIQASKDIKLSNITRSLNEPIPLIKTEDRLSRNLDDRDFTEEINGQICRLGSRNVLDDMVGAHIGTKGIYAIDRGGDRGKLYDKFLEKGKEKRFVIRLIKTRDLLHKGVRKNCHVLASALPCPHETVIIKYEDGKEEKTTVSYNALPVRLPGREYPLFLVVVKGFGKAPMMLLTSCPVNMKTKESLWRIVEIYLTRWKCDESFRYIKQCYNLEDIRVRHYTSIRNTVVLILAVAYFAAVHLGDNLKLKMLVQRIYLAASSYLPLVLSPAVLGPNQRINSSQMILWPSDSDLASFSLGIMVSTSGSYSPLFSLELMPIGSQRKRISSISE